MDSHLGKPMPVSITEIFFRDYSWSLTCSFCNSVPFSDTRFHPFKVYCLSPIPIILTYSNIYTVSEDQPDQSWEK